MFRNKLLTCLNTAIKCVCFATVKSPIHELKATSLLTCSFLKYLNAFNKITNILVITTFIVLFAVSCITVFLSMAEALTCYVEVISWVGDF